MKRVVALGLACLFTLGSASLASAQSGKKDGSGKKKMTATPSFTATVPGEAPTAMDGYCPVCIVAGKGWVKGDPSIASVIDGKRYLFPSNDVKAMFDANPAKFVPAAGGECTVCLAMGKMAAGSVQYSATFEGRLYLFPSDEIKAKFLADPAKYANVDLAHQGNCAVCMAMGKKMPGSQEFTVVHENKRYLFPSAKERDMFLAEPTKFADRG